ncbi:MAG: DUF5050 domain-containing protein [Acidobacteriota bacterium]
MKSTSPTFVKLHRRVRKLVIGLTIVSALFVTLYVVHSQNPSDPTLKGESSSVLLVPNSIVNAGEVRFKPDADHDGMSDEAEAANGTDPNNASDADGDNDGDGLSNGDEVASGSGVNNADSDGDGVSDGEEVRLGYNPADPSSMPPVGVTLVSLQVTPNPAGLVINSLLGQQPVQLTVTGLLSDASTVDLTSAANTVYQSLAPSVALVDSLGKVAGVSTGTATISVVNGARSAQATINVVSFSPSLMSFIQLAGQANNVDVSGDFAYVAVGSAGMQIVDVSDRRAPHIVSTLDTAGTANDIRVVSNLAYVADGSEGLQIIDVSNPAGPFLLGTINTPGDARDVVVFGPRAYVADGTAGLQIINVSNPSAPAIVRTVDTAGTASGVDIAGNIAVVADQSPTSGVRIIDITNEAGAQIVGTLNMSSNVEDLVTRDSLAYCAGTNNGLFIVDFSVPSLPVLRGQHTSNETGYFTPNDVALAGDFVLAAETRFTNAVPIDDVSDPSDPRYRGSLDYSATGVYDGTGIALDLSYAYTTHIRGSLSRLYIGQYQAVDTAGIPPTVTLTAPSAGVTFMEGQPIDLEASASDDIGIVGVQFRANGNSAGPLQTTPPYQLKYFVPFGISSLTLTATAFDMGANATVSQPVTVNVIPDPGTTVIGRVVDRFNQPMTNATVKVFGSYNTVAGTDGRFSFYAPSVLGNSIQVVVAADRDGQSFSGLSASVPLIVAGITDVGDVLAKPTGQIAFVRRPDGGFSNGEIYVMDSKGQNQTRLTFNTFREHTPIFSPDGLKIAFNRDECSNSRNVYVMNADGSNLVSISPGDSFVWSPDSRKLAYALNASIYISNADGSGKRVLTAVGSSFNYPAWSPDGTKLAYIGREGVSGAELYTINEDGSNRQKLTNTLGGKSEVVWSPDGAWLAFIQNDFGGQDNVFAVHPDGTGLIQLTTEDTFYWDLGWMPDSKKLVCIFESSAGSSIYLLDVNGGAPARVTNNGSAFDWGPAPSTDGVRIAFASDEGLYIVNSDGSGQQQLSETDWDPNFRPEVIPVADPGTTVTGRIVDGADQPVPSATIKLFGQTVATSGPDGTFSVAGVSTLKGNLTVIASATSGGRIDSGFSAATAPVPNGLTQVGDVRIAQKVAFVSERDGNSEIYLMDADGSNQVRVTSTEADESRPSLSSDRTKIAFATNKDGHDEIYFMNLDGSNPLRVSFVRGNCIGDSDPEWSPDGTKILFTGWHNSSNPDIYVVNADSTNLQRLTTSTALDYLPSWLPDGRIMFVSHRDNSFGEIYVMNADGSNQTRLTSNSVSEREPTWSPDNTKIAFSSFRDGRDSIFVINVDGTNEVRVTTDAASNDYPVWSYDGTRILYSSNGDGNYELYVINVDGTNRVRLTVNAFDDLQPDW